MYSSFIIAAAEEARNAHMVHWGWWALCGGVVALGFLLYGGHRINMSNNARFRMYVKDILFKMLSEISEDDDEVLRMKIEALLNHDLHTDFGDAVKLIKHNLSKVSDNVVRLETVVYYIDSNGNEREQLIRKEYDWDDAPMEMTRMLIRSAGKPQEFILYRKQK